MKSPTESGTCSSSVGCCQGSQSGPPAGTGRSADTPSPKYTTKLKIEPVRTFIQRQGVSYDKVQDILEKMLSYKLNKPFQAIPVQNLLKKNP